MVKFHTMLSAKIEKKQARVVWTHEKNAYSEVIKTSFRRRPYVVKRSKKSIELKKYTIQEEYCFNKNIDL